jgi:topoisomerase IA-like protein
MAEKTILVCDACGRPATETVTIKVDRGNFVKDLCGIHVNELVAGARKPRPGRRKAVVGASGAAPAARKSSARKTGARKTTARKTTARKTSARKPGAKKRGRPRKTATA